jgi:methylglutamate dehydrogenase subunit D
MSNPATRLSPLAGIALQGRFGADNGIPGVTLSVRHPLSLVTIIARKDKLRALNNAARKHYAVPLPPPGQSATGNGVAFHWSGAEQWFAAAEGYAEGQLYRELAERFDKLAACSDQSHGRVTLRISGPRARDVLNKGTPVDLHPSSFGPGRSAMTQMAHVGVHLIQTGPNDFELSILRGFAESFWEWLTEMSAEFGYQVR